MKDLATAAGALAFARARLDEMAACFRRLGRFESNGHSFNAFVFATCEPLADGRPGRKLDVCRALEFRPAPLALALVPPRMHTKIFGEALRAYAKASRAIGILVMTEMWMVHQEGEPGVPIEEMRKRLPRSLEDAPQRREQLVCWLEHAATGHRLWRSEILREPTRLDPWEEKADQAPHGGRLIGLVDWRS